MAINPVEWMKMGKRLQLFREQHPRFPAFLKEVNAHALIPGAVVEIKVTTPEGREYVTNLRLNEDDVESVRLAGEMRQQ